MKKYFALLLTSFISTQAFGFVLFTDGYQLANPKKTVVNYNPSACYAAGISEIDVRGSIEQIIAQYWNTVAESELRMEIGTVVDRNSLAETETGEILVTCGNAGAGAAGVTYHDVDKGSSFIVMSTLLNDSPTFMGVLAHEMGHGVGLLHSDDSASVMTYNSHGWGPKPNFLSQDDKDGVTYLYPNKGQVGGLIPGCSVEAHQRGEFRWQSVMTELSAWFALLGFIYLRIRRKGRNQRASKTSSSHSETFSG